MNSATLGDEIAAKIVAEFDLTPLNYPGFTDVDLKRWSRCIAEAVVEHLTANAELRDAALVSDLVTGNAPLGGGPITDGKVDDPTVQGGIE
jgi:hypothetical protein